MKNVLTLLLLLFGISSYAQYFWGGTTLPQIAYVGDSITVVDSVSLTTLDYRESYGILNFGDTIVIQGCYIQPGGPQGGQFLIEKTPLGLFPKGRYTVLIQGYFRNRISNECFIDSFKNSLSLNFEVFDKATGVDYSVSFNKVKFQTLIQQKIFISNLLVNTTVSIYDLTGRLHHSATNQSSEFNLDVSDWSSGVYIVAVQVGQERKRWRVFKE